MNYTDYTVTKTNLYAGTLDSLVLDECHQRGVDLQDVKGLSRKSELVSVRKAIAQRAKANAYSEKAIAEALNRDRSTIYNYLYGDI